MKRLTAGLIVGIVLVTGGTALADRTKERPDIVDFELPGPNLYFFCHGTVGVYVTEGDNDDSGKSAAPAILANHPKCPTR